MVLINLRQLVAVLSAALLIAAFSLGNNFPVRAQTLPKSEVSFETTQGVFAFSVEVAQTQAARSQGLMHREELADNAGMLFVFPKAQNQLFWMKNTPLSLDIIFIGDGNRVQHIARNTMPFSEKIISSRGPSKFVVEVRGGIAKKIGLKSGDMVILPSRFTE